MDQIQEIKDKYGQEAENIISNGLGLRKKGKKYHCPNTFAHRNGDKDPSMSWDPNALQFYCFGCGMKIDIYGYYKDHLNYTHQEIVRELLGKSNHNHTTIQKNRDAFLQEIRKITPITKECIDYIKLRGITESTIKKFNLATYDGYIAFPYYKYETAVGYKIRKPMKDPGKPKMKSITGSKPYLYNIQNIEEGMELIICEGEFDAMIIDQCGYTNVVSVGAGANSLRSLIEQAKEFLDKFEILIIVSDNDEAGQNMDKFFVEEFGDKAKLIDKKLYKRNDINEEYILYGKEKVVELIESARFKIEGRRDLENQPYKGLESRAGKYIPTGLETIDYGLNDLGPGLVTLITGRSNGGKSTLVRQIIANAIDKDNKVYLMSGEGDPEIFLNEMYQSVIGRHKEYYNTIKINKRYRKEPKKEILEKLKKWHYKKLTLFNKGDSKLKTINELTSMLEMEIKINNYNLIVIDNLMSILSVQASEKYEQQADFMQRLCDMSKAYRTHIILVLHPNKTYKKGEDMDFEQINGTSDLYNKADNIITVIREYKEENINQGINGKIAVLKNRYYNDLPKVEIHYDEDTGLLLEISEDNQIIGYSFHWDPDIPEGFQLAIDEDCPF
ncbi:DnaB-like helicase C-terminal domain-containing protein [Tissierella praeacuta]|uniref:DnaB-like helicase C-terminal domain-containing protein n=1 Tax=Tissierella praeacuta TaxID=43131 RepID=UPI0033415B13